MIPPRCAAGLLLILLPVSVAADLFGDPLPAGDGLGRLWRWKK